MDHLCLYLIFELTDFISDTEEAESSSGEEESSSDEELGARVQQALKDSKFTFRSRSRSFSLDEVHVLITLNETRSLLLQQTQQ